MKLLNKRVREVIRNCREQYWEAHFEEFDHLLESKKAREAFTALKEGLKLARLNCFGRRMTQEPTAMDKLHTHYTELFRSRREPNTTNVVDSAEW